MLKPLIASRAKENERHGGNTAGVGRQNSDNPVDTKRELAEIAGVSHDTISNREGKGVVRPVCSKEPDSTAMDNWLRRCSREPEVSHAQQKGPAAKPAPSQALPVWRFAGLGYFRLRRTRATKPPISSRPSVAGSGTATPVTCPPVRMAPSPKTPCR